MKKILIFTAGFGEGHNTAARNIRDGIEAIDAETQVDIVDLFEFTYGSLNRLARKAYVTAINKTPKLWQGIYDWIDHSSFLNLPLSSLTKLKQNLEELLNRTQPDVVISTYPLYNSLIDQIYKQGRQRHFTQITMVTDSISINSVWYRYGSDQFLVANTESASVLKQAGISPERIRVFGFPVQLQFCSSPIQKKPLFLTKTESPQILYILNSGKKKAKALIRRLLSILIGK